MPLCAGIKETAEDRERDKARAEFADKYDMGGDMKVSHRFAVCWYHSITVAERLWRLAGVCFCGLPVKGGMMASAHGLLFLPSLGWLDRVAGGSRLLFSSVTGHDLLGADRQALDREEARADDREGLANLQVGAACLS